MSEKWNQIIDVARCDNCRACFIAVKDEYVGNDFPGVSAAQPAQGHNWLDVKRKERGTYPLVQAHFLPVMRNHCDDAPCMKAARDGAVSKRADGIVIIDPVKSKGQKQIAEACPYGAVSWNAEKDIPQAWPFDAHLLDAGWTQTRAEQACPTRAIRTLKISDAGMQRVATDEKLAVLQPELGTRPRVYYKNLHLHSKCFVGGTVVARRSGVDDCATGAEVLLKKDGHDIGRAQTDTFGEFTIDGLDPNSGRYRLEISADGGRCEREFELGTDSRYLGVLVLS